MQIPIQNIYYLLCYAWNKLDESEIVNVNALDSTELIDLFAKILSNGVSRLLKQGLDRCYIDIAHIVNGIKGKLDLSLTLKRNLLFSKKTFCNYDDFDYDILHNQIIKTTIRNLIKIENLDLHIKDELCKIYIKLPPISEIKIQKNFFSKIRLHRNNYHYDFILKVCQLIHENLLIDESSGNYKFKEFFRDEKAMAKLFENFIRNFFKIEQSEYKVSVDQIKWNFSSENAEDLHKLPSMFTDITLQTKKRKIIIDTKYYKEALSSRYNNEKINSANLYQLFSYINNQKNDTEVTKTCEGILLYPTVENEFLYTFYYGKHKISVMSINLNQDWKSIKKDILNIL